MGALQSLAFLNWPVVLGVIALFVVLRLRGARTLTWTLACWLGIYAFVRYGFATQVVSVTVIIFFLLIGFVFWLASLSSHEREDA